MWHLCQGVDMPKLVLKSLLLTLLVTSPAFADDLSSSSSADESLNAYNLQGDVVHAQLKAEESFFATRAPMPSESRGYFGLNLGASTDSLKPKITKDANGPETVSKQAIGYAGGLYGGYGKNFDHFYIGAELSGGYNMLNRNIHMTTFSSKVSVAQPLAVAIDLMPGYMNQQRDFLLYCRLGVGAGLFKFKLDDDSDSSAKQIAFSVRAGLGMEYFFVPAFSMRVEYLLNNYGGIKKNYISSSGTAYSYEFSSPRVQQVNLGFTINF